ncbi:MAG: hypothetical protein JG776_81 [Caloramator sp.]|jgi:uncharacterized membrane protein YobD (UPF0266 family)|nr:hypothetical protein [Caloramator sp.]
MGKTNKKIKLHKKKASDKNANIKWIVMIIIWTFTISASISFVSNSLLSGVGIFLHFSY